MYEKALGSFTFTSFDTIPNDMVVSATNNGHAFTVSVGPKGKFKVSGGGLNGTFSTAQFHFHWSTPTGKGSEHTVDGEQFPGEVSFQFINSPFY